MSSNSDHESYAAPTILAFHKLLNRISYGVSNFSPKRFEKLLAVLHKSNYNFISLDQLETAGERDIFITFDDGYAHLAEVLPPFIRTYNIKPLIFIPTRYIGQVNDWDYSCFFQKTEHMNASQIQNLASLGVDFGSHSHSHKRLDRLDDADCVNELKQSKTIIESIINKNINSISYPFGRTSKAVSRLVDSVGYSYGFTMQFPKSSDAQLSLGRIPIYSYDTIGTIIQKIERGPLYKLEQAKSKVTTALSSGTDLLNRMRKK